MVIQRSKGLAEEVYKSIFDKIMSLDIAPGSRITVDNLVRELEVSQTPIREALGRLEGEGLVVKTHHIGYSAAPQITRRRFDELYDLRLQLEPYAAGLAARRIDPPGLQSLSGNAEAMTAINGADENLRYATFARLDAVFHEQIFEIAGNELVRDVLAAQHTHFHLFRLLYHARVTEEALIEHQAIMDAIANKDKIGAELAMRRHLEMSRQRLVMAFT